MSYAPSKTQCLHWRAGARSGQKKLTLRLALDIAKASIAADRILNMRIKDHSEGHLISLDAGNIGDSDQGVKIEFCDVWFKYPTRDVPVLNGLDLTVRPQEVAVGEQARTDQL